MAADRTGATVVGATVVGGTVVAGGVVATGVGYGAAVVAAAGLGVPAAVTVRPRSASEATSQNTAAIEARATRTSPPSTSPIGRRGGGGAPCWSGSRPNSSSTGTPSTGRRGR